MPVDAAAQPCAELRNVAHFGQTSGQRRMASTEIAPKHQMVVATTRPAAVCISRAARYAVSQ